MLRHAGMTLAAFLLYAVATVVYAPQATLLSSQTAANQFADKDASAWQSLYTINFLSGANGLITLGLIIVLLAIWWGPLRRYVALLTIVGIILVGQPPKAWSFADTTDKTEAYTILPNESAFWIPDIGANKETQSQFDSEVYLQEKKIAVKRFVVPHQKLSGSGGTAWLSGWDYYVPTGRLIIVDRTPYSREWVDASDRGTSSRKEGFPCQSKEGINITAGVAIGTSVLEQNAAKYLYRFGVNPPQGERSDPKIIFASVYYGRKLSDVMDDVGRKMIQTLVCNEISSRGFDKVNEEAVAIIDIVRKKSTEYFSTVGITLDFIGWADTFSFDKDVQAAVNRRYVASQDQIIAATLAPYTQTIQALAAAQALRSFGEKTDGRLPSTIVGLPTGLGELLNALLHSGGLPATSTAK